MSTATATVIPARFPSTNPPDPHRSTVLDQLDYADAALNRLRTRLRLARLRVSNGGLTALPVVSRRALESIVDGELLPICEDLGLGMGGIYGGRLAALERAHEIQSEAERIAEAQKELRR